MPVRADGGFLHGQALPEVLLPWILAVVGYGGFGLKDKRRMCQALIQPDVFVLREPLDQEGRKRLPQGHPCCDRKPFSKDMADDGWPCSQRLVDPDREKQDGKASTKQNQRLAIHLAQFLPSGFRQVQEKPVHALPDAREPLGIGWVREGKADGKGFMADFSEEAFAALRKMAGEKLDSDCVEALLAHREEIEAVQRQFKENVVG